VELSGVDLDERYGLDREELAYDPWADELPDVDLDLGLVTDSPLGSDREAA
jgi:hypothetical protein